MIEYLIGTPATWFLFEKKKFSHLLFVVFSIGQVSYLIINKMHLYTKDKDVTYSYFQNMEKKST